MYATENAQTHHLGGHGICVFTRIWHLTTTKPNSESFFPSATTSPAVFPARDDSATPLSPVTIVLLFMQMQKSVSPSPPRAPFSFWSHQAMAEHNASLSPSLIFHRDISPWAGMGFADACWLDSAISQALHGGH
jgi:hypothetical protein